MQTKPKTKTIKISVVGKLLIFERVNLHMNLPLVRYQPVKRLLAWCSLS